MFLYEVISLKQPYDGRDQMKDFILEGRRPYVSEKVIFIFFKRNNGCNFVIVLLNYIV